MKNGNLRGSVATVPPAATNGTHRGTKKNGTGPKRPAGPNAPADVCSSPEAFAAPFAATEASPVDATAWPIHPAVWFQPDLRPSAPPWTALTIERHNRIPAPDFLHPKIAPLDCRDCIDDECCGIRPVLRVRVPPSSLEPLGWDPRTVCRKEGGE
jgi:hypothetical protein